MTFDPQDLGYGALLGEKMTEYIGLVIFLVLVLFVINRMSDGGVKRAAKWLWNAIK